MASFSDFNLLDGPELDAALKARPSSGAAASTEPDLTLEDKVNYLFAQAKQLEALLAQAGPLLEQAGPLLASAGPLLASANSPLGRIAGSLFR